VPLKVGEILKLIEADGWYLSRDKGKSSAIQTPV